MSKKKVYIMPNAKKPFFVESNTLEDVFDTKRFPPKFGSFRAILGQKNEERAALLAKKLFKRMLQLMLDDMMINKVGFVLPKHRCGMITITDMRAHRKDTMHWKRYGLLNERVYGGVVVLHPIMRGMIGKRQYRWKMTAPNRDRLINLIKQGHRWPTRYKHGIH